MTSQDADNGYSRLRSEKIVETLRTLERRIHERFPDAGLGRACAELVETAEQTALRVERLARPNIGLRLLVAATLILAIGLGIGVLDSLISEFNSETGVENLGVGVAQTLESIVNLVILAALALWYIFRLERGLTRQTALAHLHELRSYAHVVDMHQLVKDPASILKGVSKTVSSPDRRMSDAALLRYLDYCTEMLAIIGKLAALYGERTQDEQIIAGASDIENLTTNLARKIWQKIITIEGGRLNDAR